LKDSSNKTLITLGYWKTWQNVFAVTTSAFWKVQNLKELPLSSYKDGVKKMVKVLQELVELIEKDNLKAHKVLEKNNVKWV
jgi:hypothetical protein